MFDYHYTHASQQIRDGTLNAKILVLHPNYASQHLLLGALLEEPNSVYVRFDGEAITQDALHAQLDTALLELTGGPLLDVVGNLVLDECDRADDDAFDALLEYLLSVLKDHEHSRLVVISRTTPRAILKNIEVRELTCFVPMDDGLMLCNYVKDLQGKTLLEVQALGAGWVSCSGRLLNTWDGALPRSLFYYLVDRGMVTRNEIFNIFWPTLTKSEATNVFHVTKRKINEVLGRDLTVYWAGFYRIAPDIDLVYDLMSFSKLVQDSAVASAEEAKDMLLRALHLYRGSFLSSLNMPWANRRREEVSQTYSEVLTNLAKIYEQEEQTLRALGLYMRAAIAKPHREDVAQSVMQLYARLGRVRDALDAYDRLEQRLSADLGVQPAPQLQALAHSLRQHGATGASNAS